MITAAWRRADLVPRLAALRKRASSRRKGDQLVADLVDFAAERTTDALALAESNEAAAARLGDAWLDLAQARRMLIRAGDVVEAAARALDAVEPDVPPGEGRLHLDGARSACRVWLDSRYDRHDPDYLGPVVGIASGGRQLTFRRPIDVRPGDRVALFVSATPQETP